MGIGSETFAPGERLIVRDAEWVVRRVDATSTGGYQLTVVGLSELVCDKEAVFLTEIEPRIEVVDPANTGFVADPSPHYRQSFLYLESLLRQTPPTDTNLYVGHRAAMDLVPYQLDPAVQALEQPRQRILIADAVGLGKTLEAGILLSELIRRGKAKRILVLAIKSMLTQFQKELWSRFTIPLVRLDSVGIQRVRSRIPTNHNPFHYFDRAIISIDTLKQDAEYRTYLEDAYWDVIVIDEAHNVAERGGGASLRARLAKLLARRSDTLILLSATPHDGRARSFASLMNMLNPTAIADPDNYTKDDIKGLFIRRFKKDIQDQVTDAFRPREIREVPAAASPAEEAAFEALAGLEFRRLDQRRTGGAMLFKTLLEKSLLSSPAACLQTLGTRLRRLEDDPTPEARADAEALRELARRVEAIGVEDFSRYHALLKTIRQDFGWDGSDPTDRLVVFTERVETLKFLREHLPRDLGLRPEQVEHLHGGLSDVEQQRVVEDFGREEAPVRLLIASDVASEGINLHYLSHRMIHFDIPWSLMVFQQRNGRIDRYGQKRTPQIVYLVTRSENPKIRGDVRILEILIRKDEEATKNIGDPSAFMGVYDEVEEERITAGAIEAGKSAEEFERELDREAALDPLELLLRGAAEPPEQDSRSRIRSMPSLFPSDYDYVCEALEHLAPTARLQSDCIPDDRAVTVTATDELRHRLRNRIPAEAWPDDGVFVLSADAEKVKREIERCRKDERAWPRVQYLWELHPVVEWLNDKVLASFGRAQAPVLALPGVLGPDEVVFVVSGLIPNRRGQPVIHNWYAIGFHGEGRVRVEDFAAFAGRIGLAPGRFPNPGRPVDEARLRPLLSRAVEAARTAMSEARRAFENRVNPKLNEQLEALDRLRKRQHEQLELAFGGAAARGAQAARKERRRREIDAVFDEYIEWIEDTLCTEDRPYLHVAAVMTG